MESACPMPRPAPLEIDPRVAGTRQVDSREFRIGGRHVGVARLGKRRGLELVAGIERAELEIAAGVGLKRVDQLAGRIELEIAAGIGRRNFPRRTQERALAHRGVAPALRADEPMIGGVLLDQGDVGIARMFVAG